MKHVERHRVAPLEDWRSEYGKAVQVCSDILENLSAMPEAAADLVVYARRRAAWASWGPDTKSEICAAVRFGSAAAAAAFAAICHANGAIVASLDDRAVQFPAIGPTSTTHPAAWLTAFSFAAICRDGPALEILCRETTIEASLASAYRVDDFWKPLMASLSSLVRGDVRLCAELIEEAEGALRQPLIDPAGLADIEANIWPLLSLSECIVSPDGERWNALLVEGLRRHRDFWGADDRLRDDEGFLAFGMLGLCALAHDRGLTTTVDSPYLPMFLITAECGRHQSDVLYRSPRCQARSANEAHLFLDLNGCHPSNRIHQLAMDEGQLVALYECEQAAGGERLAFEFALVEEDLGAVSPLFSVGGESPSVLIDAGEFLLLAERFASLVPADPEALSEQERVSAHTLLQKAIACLEEVLKFIPPGVSTVPDRAFWTSRGKAVRRAEPGRFERPRLEAVLTAWRKLLARFGSLPVEPSEDAARLQALAAMDRIAEQVTPLLLALRGPEQAHVLAELQPRADDYAKVFGPELADVVRKAYEALWQQGIRFKAADDQTAIRVAVSPAGMLGYENELSFRFPRGYRSVAHLLNPHRTWVAWKYTRPNETSGMAYDGLVWIDDHWAWFPKPYRVLGQILSDATVS